MSFGIIAAKLISVFVILPTTNFHPPSTTEIFNKNNIWPSQRTCEAALSVMINDRYKCLNVMIPDYFITNGFEASQSKLLEVGPTQRQQPPPNKR